MGEKPVRTSEWGRICSCNCTARAWVHSEPLSWEVMYRGYDPCMDTWGARRVWIKTTEQSQRLQTTSGGWAPLTGRWSSAVIQLLPDWNVHSRLPVASRLGYFRRTRLQMCMFNCMDTNTFNDSFSFVKQQAAELFNKLENTNSCVFLILFWCHSFIRATLLLTFLWLRLTDCKDIKI